jgi:RNA polymerase-binding transcription factor DksA
MPSARLRSIPDDMVLQRARELLARRLASMRAGDPARDPLSEALQWIDRGVYGGCSVCGASLSAAQILANPADKVCPSCRRLARRDRDVPAAE